MNNSSFSFLLFQFFIFLNIKYNTKIHYTIDNSNQFNPLNAFGHDFDFQKNANGFHQCSLNYIRWYNAVMQYNLLNGFRSKHVGIERESEFG